VLQAEHVGEAGAHDVKMWEERAPQSHGSSTNPRRRKIRPMLSQERDPYQRLSFVVEHCCAGLRGMAVNGCDLECTRPVGRL
jgi:hypothetical protein